MPGERTLAVIGATGTQGGSAVKEFLSKPGWKVRGITRNTESDAAKSLASQGIEVVSANLDDEASLVKAFEGVDVVFGVTNWWEIFATNGMDPHAAGELEYQHALNIANAAARTSTLSHYVFSTVEIETHSNISVPHIDYKAKAAAYIKENMKDLSAKTTFCMLGYYPENIGNVPMLKPLPTASDKPRIYKITKLIKLKSPYTPDIQLFSVAPSTMVTSAGDVRINTGIVVSAIVENPQLTLPAKYAVVQTDYISLEDQLKMWSEISDRPSIPVQIDLETYVKIWGPYGAELDLNMKAFKDQTVKGWNLLPGVVTCEQLGIADKLHNTKQALENLHARLNGQQGQYSELASIPMTPLADLEDPQSE